MTGGIALFTRLLFRHRGVMNLTFFRVTLLMGLFQVMTPDVYADLGTLRVSAVQYPIQGGLTVDAYFQKVEKWIIEAKTKKADLVIFPELIGLDVKKAKTLSEELIEIPEIAKNVTPKYFDFIKAQAKKTQMMILGGSIPRMTSNGKIRNTAILAFPDGTAIFQDKMFMTPDEVDWKWEPGEELQAFTHPKLGRFVITTCYDSEFPQISALLAKANPALILVPSMTGYKGLKRVRFTSQGRAVEHYAYVVVTGTVSAKGSQDKEDVGQAVMVPPQDEGFPDFVAEGPYNVPALVSGVLDLKHITEMKPKAGVFPAREGVIRTAPLVLKEVNL